MRVQPRDEKIVDDVALQHITLLGDGHCIALIQVLL